MQRPQQPEKILRWERLRQLITEKVRVTTASAEHHRYWAGVKDGLEWLLIEMMSMPAEDLSAPAYPVEEKKLNSQYFFCRHLHYNHGRCCTQCDECKPSPVIEIGEQPKPEDLPQTENPLASYWFEKARLCLVDRNDFKAQLARANEKIVELAKASHHNKNQENA